MTDSHIDK
jgi:hypothetical protein